MYAIVRAKNFKASDVILSTNVHRCTYLSRSLFVTQSAVGSRQSAVGSRQSAVGSRQSAVGSRQSAVGSRQSAVGSRQSAVGSRQSAVGSRQSAVGSRQSAVDSRLTHFKTRAAEGLARVKRPQFKQILRCSHCSILAINSHIHSHIQTEITVGSECISKFAHLCMRAKVMQCVLIIFFGKFSGLKQTE